MILFYVWLKFVVFGELRCLFCGGYGEWFVVMKLRVLFLRFC